MTATTPRDELVACALLLTKAADAAPADALALLRATAILLSDASGILEHAADTADERRPAPAAGGRKISHDGKQAEVSERQAILFMKLSEEMPGFVGRDALARAIWGAKPPSWTKNAISTLCRTMAPQLAELGLKTKARRGAGIALLPVGQG